MIYEAVIVNFSALWWEGSPGATSADRDLPSHHRIQGMGN